MSLPLIPGVVSNQTIRTVEHAAQLLVEHDMSAVVVTSPEGQLVGIVTERDLARRVVARNLLASDVSVTDLVSTEVHTLGLAAHACQPYPAFTPRRRR